MLSFLIELFVRYVVLCVSSTGEVSALSIITVIDHRREIAYMSSNDKTYHGFGTYEEGGRGILRLYVICVKCVLTLIWVEMRNPLWIFSRFLLLISLQVK